MKKKFAYKIQKDMQAGLISAGHRCVDTGRVIRDGDIIQVIELDDGDELRFDTLRAARQWICDNE
jgi:hypothetical protein